MFPDSRISSTRLHKIYRQHYIKKKRVRQAKLPPSLSMGSYVNKTEVCRQQLGAASRRGHPIIYCDETLFTRHTFQPAENLHRKEPLTADARAFYLEPVWVIAFVEAERGVVHTATYTNSLDGKQFLEYCRQVSVKMRA